MLSSSSSSFSFPLCPLSSSLLSAIPPPSRTRVSRSPTTSRAASCSYACKVESRLRSSPRRLPESASLYEILEIPAGATGHEIKTAYRRLARICHPDSARTEWKLSSADEFMKIHAAYCTLSDPEKRAVYDRKLIRRSSSFSVGISGLNGRCGRNWETDQCW